MPDLSKRILFLYIFPCLLAWGVSSCSAPPTQEPFGDCRYGAPEPIFYPGLASVSSHNFHLGKDGAVEELVFSDGLALTIVQAGCEHIRQEFHFHWDGDFRSAPNEYWFGEAARVFNRLGRFGPEYLTYRSLAQAIAENAGRIRLKESTKLQEGFFLKINTLLSADEATLLITISEQP